MPADGTLAAISPRIGLRPRYARHNRQRGSARGQMQECAAGQVSWLPSQDDEATSRALLCGREGRKGCFRARDQHRILKQMKSKLPGLARIVRLMDDLVSFISFRGLLGRGS